MGLYSRKRVILSATRFTRRPHQHSRLNRGAEKPPLRGSQIGFDTQSGVHIMRQWRTGALREARGWCTLQVVAPLLVADGAIRHRSERSAVRISWRQRRPGIVFLHPWTPCPWTSARIGMRGRSIHRFVRSSDRLADKSGRRWIIALRLGAAFRGRLWGESSSAMRPVTVGLAVLGFGNHHDASL